jgi:hypothetical protein
MQNGMTNVADNSVADNAAQSALAVSRLLRKAPFEEPRVVSFSIDFLAPKAPIAYAGNG